MNGSQLTEHQQQLEDIKEQQKDLYKLIMQDYANRKKLMRMLPPVKPDAHIRQCGEKFINFELIQASHFAITSNFNLANEVITVVRDIKDVSYDD